MKIVIVPSWYPSSAIPANGIFIREQAKALASRMEVAVLTPRFPSLGELATLRWGPRMQRIDDDGIDTWHVRKLKLTTLRRWIPFMRSPDHVLVYYRKFAATIRAGFAQYVRTHGAPDLLHAHVVFPGGWVALELARRYRVPLVLTEHSEPFAMHLQTPTQQRLAGEILTGADRVIAISDYLRATLQEFCPTLRVDVVGEVIDTGFFRPGPALDRSRRPLRFFVLCFLTPRKGIQFLFEAVQLLQAQGRDRFEIVVGGDGPYRSTLEALARNLGVRGRIRFLGMLDRDQVRTQMQACDVFVLPSLGETFGVVLGEAMACGKPVLSTRCGAPEEVVTPETGVLVPPGDPHSLAKAMGAFLDGAVALDANAIRTSVERRFGSRAFVARMETIYAEVLRKQARAAAA